MKRYLISILLATLTAAPLCAQESREEKTRHSVDCRGQLSVWTQFAPDIGQWLWAGGRYIPQLNYEISFPAKSKLDFELSANLFGNVGTKPFTETTAAGKIKPYRAWIRYSTQQLEVRFGLQKINFGSAQMLRPLMWFDTMDPRDPLQLTDGVWGGLLRYYFKNNANIWFWTLYGNKNPKGWEAVGSSKSLPEFGVRVQYPLKGGEIALSGHFRKANYNILGDTYKDVPEGRLGFDIRLDRTIGMWFEGSWTHSGKELGELTNQLMMTLGGDYTIGIGNGLGITFEQLLYTHDHKLFAFGNITTLSGLMFTYPLGLFDDISLMLYYDWMGSNLYSFINWQHSFRYFDLHTMLYWNPKGALLPGQLGSDRFFGKGIQIMLVWNH